MNEQSIYWIDLQCELVLLSDLLKPRDINVLFLLLLCAYFVYIDRSLYIVFCCIMCIKFFCVTRFLQNNKHKLSDTLDYLGNIYL